MCRLLVTDGGKKVLELYMNLGLLLCLSCTAPLTDSTFLPHRVHKHTQTDTHIYVDLIALDLLHKPCCFRSKPTTCHTQQYRQVFIHSFCQV